MIEVALLLSALGQGGAEEPPPAPAAWRPFDYSFLEASYAHVDIDGESNADGFAVNASLDVTENAFGYIGILSTETGGSSDADLDVLEFGLGMHTPLGDRLDFVGSAGALYAEPEALGLGDDEGGFRLRAGARYHLSPRLELDGGFGVVELDDPETFFDAALLFGLAGPLHLRAGMEFSEDATGLFLGLRLYPGT
jgi:hypothetical protein